jgi:AcrR family transcriptional regulator
MPPATSASRPPLTRNRVLDAAVGLADRIGADALTIRKLAQELDVKPMTLYHHVANKEAILDGMVDRVFAEIEPPPLDIGWREAMERRAHSARDVLRRHGWAAPLMETRVAPGPANLAHHEAVLACLRGAGFSLALTAHAYASIDAFLYGFALQEANLPFEEGSGEQAEVIDRVLAAMPIGQYPHLAELTTDHVLRPGYSFGHSFQFGLGLILDGLEAALARETG